jgi:Fur family ferric uptake transcriptional regulator
LEEQPRFLSAQELHAFLDSRNARVGLATVYRTLQALETSGEVDVVRSSQGESLYRLCGIDEHHHHIVCRACGTTAELHSKALETWVRDSARDHGFSAVTHTAEIFGLCSDCA